MSKNSTRNGSESTDQEENDSPDFSDEREELLKEIKDLEDEKGRLKEINEKLKKRKKQLQEKVTKLGEENRKLLDRLRETDQSKEIEGIVLPSNSEIRGDIKSEKKIKVENEALIQGSLESRDDIIIEHKNKIKGDVISNGGAVKIGNSTEVDGLIKGESVHLAEGVISGPVTAKDKVTIEENCELSDLYAVGNLNLGEDVEICGDVKYSGKINADKGVSVKGSLEANSEEELQKEMEKVAVETPPLLPIFLHDNEEKKSEKDDKDDDAHTPIRESAAESIERVRELLRTAREKDIDIAEEKNMVKKGVSFYKEESYEEAQSRFDRCKTSLEAKMDSSSEEVIDEEEASSQSETEGEKKEDVDEDSERSKASLTKEEIIESFQEINGVGRSTAEKLYKGGFDTIEELKNASKKDLSKINGIGKARSEKLKKNI